MTPQGAQAIAIRKTREHLAAQAEARGLIDARPQRCAACSALVDLVDLPSMRARGQCARCSCSRPDETRPVVIEARAEVRR